jgi:hypothetical protein
MSLDLADYKQASSSAVAAFWNSRVQARRKQKSIGKSDQGHRSDVTAGKNMNGFLALITALVKRNGLERAEICLQRRALTLPGFFRPTKVWDILVLHEGRLVAAVELKSQVGSFGNNFNNRTEEALGTAVDFWTAYREGAFGEIYRPFVGWLMLLEDCPASRASVRDVCERFTVFPEFKGASYAQRYDIFCRKLTQERLYTAASVILSPRGGGRKGMFSELSDLTNLSAFTTSFAGHIAITAARK